MDRISSSRAPADLPDTSEAGRNRAVPVVIVQPDEQTALGRLSGSAPRTPHPPPRGRPSREAALRLRQALESRQSAALAEIQPHVLGIVGAVSATLGLAGLGAVNLVVAHQGTATEPTSQTVGLSALGGLLGTVAIGMAATALYAAKRLRQAVNQNRIAESARNDPAAVMQLPDAQQVEYVRSVLSEGQAFVHEGTGLIARIRQNPDLRRVAGINLDAGAAQERQPVTTPPVDGVLPDTGTAPIMPHGHNPIPQQADVNVHEVADIGAQLIAGIDAHLMPFRDALPVNPDPLTQMQGPVNRQALLAAITNQPNLYNRIAQFIAYANVVDAADRASHFTVAGIDAAQPLPAGNQHSGMQRRGDEAV